MKKFNIFFICFIILYAAVIIYVGIRYEPHSAYWLVFELLFFVIALFGHFHKAIKTKENGKWVSIWPVIFWLLWCGYYSYREIAKYNTNHCFDKFGPEFNARRHSLGVPLIPAEWHEGYAYKHSVDWEQKDSTAGHHSKNITIDSTCALIAEYDEYCLKRVREKSRDLSILTKYARGKGVDSMVFSYYGGDTTQMITRQQADSIFAAEKIKKDY